MNTACICSHCRRVVDYAEGIFDDDLWYHPRCYYSKVKKEVDSLEKKYRNGYITLEEYEYLQELLPIAKNIKQVVRQPSVTFGQVLGTPTSPVFEGKSEGMCMVENHRLALESHNEQIMLETKTVKQIGTTKEMV